MFAYSLPRHLYGFVAKSLLTNGERRGWEPALWFGLLLEPTEAPLLSVLLECGAIYRRVPPHAWRFGTVPPKSHGPWSLEQAARYNSFGREAGVVEYDALSGLCAQVIPEKWIGRYLFSLEFFGDSYSREPTQSKALHAIELDTGCLTFQPGHHVVFFDPSFTRAARIPPRWLRRSRQRWTVDEPEE